MSCQVECFYERQIRSERMITEKDEIGSRPLLHHGLVNVPIGVKKKTAVTLGIKVNPFLKLSMLTGLSATLLGTSSPYF